MKKQFKKSIALLLTALMLVTSVQMIAGAASAYNPSGDFYKISETEYKIAPGISENRVIVNKASGTQQEMVYAVTVGAGTSTTGFLAGYADYNGSRWKMQSVRDQAAKAAQATGKNIVVAVNADIFNMSTGEPAGVLVMDGNIYQRGIGRSYFGITKDGQIVIGDNLTETMLANLQEAISGFYMIVKNGQRVGPGLNPDSNVAPKTAVGLKADGSVVIVTVDGRNYPISCSLGDYDLATIMLDLGCVDVLNLDGGGSTTYLAKYEGEGALNLKNNPSDAVERKVSSCLFVYSSATPSGVFDHASLSPNNEVYTPGSEVQFSAIGVDSAGEPADLPADGSFALTDEAFGSITAEGLFVSNGTTGTVTVNYMSGGAVAGSTSIEVQKPDEIYFSDEEVSLGYEETKTSKELSLVVRYQDRDMIIKPGDIVWTTNFDTPMQGDKFEFNGRNVIYDSGDFHYYHSEQQGTAGSTSGKLVVVVDEALTNEEKTAFFPTILGTFDGNSFTSAAGNTVNGTITATSAFNAGLSASIHAVIGRLPVVIGDFEGEYSIGRWAFNANGGMLLWESEPGDYDLVTGHYYDGSTNTSRGGVESAETVDVDSGEPVRFGNQSLKINYDFTHINGIEGACVGFAQQSQEIPGNPTGIGLWLYNPEGGRNFWLRIRLLDGMNNILTLDFTKQREGINWFGWKYVECDLTKHQGPFKLLGGETIRLMHTFGAYDGMGNYLAGTVSTAGPDANSVFLGQETCKGSVYVDNLQFVYGANNDDVDNPVIDSMSINNGDLESGKTVVNTSEVNLNAYVSDVQNKYTTGVDYNVVRIYVDGVNHTYDNNGDNVCVITEGDGRIDLYGLQLADGDHSMTVLVRDKFGNETSETRFFTVDTQGESDVTGVNLTPADDPLLGQNFALELKSNDLQAIQSATAKVKINEAFSNFNVVFCDGFTGTSSYNETTKEITLEATATGEEKTDSAIARILFPISTATPKGTQFTYSVTNGQFVKTDESEGSFACAPKYLDVVAAYTVSASAAVVGHEVIINVKDRNDDAVAGASVYADGDTLIGVTDETGTLVTDALTANVANIDLYAEKDGAISFVYSLQSVAAAGNADGTPFSLMLNAAEDSETGKNITWLSNPAVNTVNAVVQYAEKADYDANGEDAFITVNGEAKLVDFLGSADVNSNYGAILNKVVLTGLTKNTEYVYRAGDGTVFSPVYNFKTARKGFGVNFFIIGDTQTSDGEIENIRAIQQNLAEDGTDYDFGTQLGDFVEKGNMYADWEDILTAYDVDFLKSTDQIHVIGNHEAFGYALGTDVDDIFAPALYNMPNGKCFSAEYGNVYVAVISYTNSETVLQNCIDWLRADAANTNCRWKILLTHQPAYGTNAASMDTEHFTRLLPPVLEELGFDFMFSGHDHAYARTEPLTGGEIDRENGVVYFVCGSTGEKSYTATDMPSHHNAVCSQDYENGIYLTVETTDTEFTVTTREGNGDILDTYTKTVESVCGDEHTFVYGTDGYLTCSVCGYCESLGTYTGFATDEATGKTRYFIGGNGQTGWLNLEKECYYFDENGCSISAGKHTIDGITYKFDADGKQVGGAFVKTEEGYTRCYRGGNYLTGWNEIDGKTYFFSTSASHPGKMLTGKTTIKIFTGQKITYNFASDGHLTDYVWVTDESGTRYYWAQTPVTGWQEIGGKTYYFDPATALMQTGDVEIDGTAFGFGNDGVLMHEGAHNYEFFQHTAVSCTEDEADVYKCTICGNTDSHVLTASPGHVDEDGDDLCDVCGKYYKARISFLEPILRFFARIRSWIRNLFRRG